MELSQTIIVPSMDAVTAAGSVGENPTASTESVCSVAQSRYVLIHARNSHGQPWSARLCRRKL